MKKRVIFLLTIFMWMTGTVFSQSLTVVSMPSNSANKMEGNAILNEPIEIWGSARGGNPPYIWQIYVDDQLVGSGSTNEGHFIGIDYSFHTLGKRIVKLVVNGDTARSSIRVHYDPINMIKVNMMIEKGLLYLYKNRIKDAQGRVYWPSSQGKPGYEFAGTSASILAFEEFGHLASNDDSNDPYADLVSGGLRWILSKYSGQKAIQNHDDGTGNIRISDIFTDAGGPSTSGSGLLKGSFTYAPEDPGVSYDMYANAFGLLAVVLSQRNSTEAQNYIIQDGYFQGWTLFNFMKDALDLLYWSQGDGSTRGGWRYFLIQNSCLWDWYQYDGSCHQWPALVFKASIDRWQMVIPEWVKENAIYGYNAITNSSGGCGYTGPNQYTNCGKTGGMLAAYSWFNKYYQQGNGDPDAVNSVNFINTYYNNYGGGDHSQDYGAGWAGNFYPMYALKKGMQLQNTNYIGEHDWYQDMVAWLSGEQIGSLPPEFSSLSSYFTSSNGYGQNPDGSWIESTWMLEYPISTAHALLILIQAVTVLPPIAVIEELPPQPPNTSFRLDGSHSFHLDLSSSIIEWNWDFNGDGQFDDGKGQRPTCQGFGPGTFPVSLQVVDDNNPALTDIDKIFITITAGDHPPIAVPIPDSLLPCYAGRVNQQIHIDGRESFDPDGTQISDYSWDTDGDGDTGDMDQSHFDLSFNKKYNGQVGLKVTSNGVLSTQRYADIFISDDDLYIGELKASPVYQGTSKVDVFIKFYNNGESSLDYDSVLVRLFDDNPFTNGNRIGKNYYVDLPVGGSDSLQLPLDINVSIKKVYAYLDADQRIEEWNEVNNYKPVDIIKFGNDDTLTICENSEILIDLFENDYDKGYSLKLVSLPVLPAQGSASIINDSSVLYRPAIGFFSPPQDLFSYNMEIRNILSNELVGYDTSDVNITVNPIPKVFGNNDTILACPLDSVIISAGNPGATYQWSNGETTQSIKDSTTGAVTITHEFIVQVTNSYDCQTTDTIMVYYVWESCREGINWQSIDNGFISIFPNPTAGNLFIKSCKDHIYLFEISIIDIYGQILYQKNLCKSFNENELINAVNLSSNPDGLYFLRIKSENGNVLHKVIVRH